MQYIIYYAILINAIAVVLCVYDKLAAGKGLTRVAERTLFCSALFGGTPALYLSMLLVRHKTRHITFMVGLPLLLLLQAALLVGLYYLCQAKGVLI